MAATILEARCVAPFVVRVRFSDGMEGEASLEPCLFDWDLARVPDLTPDLREWLRVPENFATVRLDADAGTLAWGDARPFSPSIVTVVEGTTTAGGTTASTPGETWRVPMREPLLLELGDCTVQVE
ncbi:hypothetical protein D7V80_20635 [Corallococcus sp. CA054B]|uniref:hypothetical protein n=1 Tax=Corallococcus sp. CA054B TaxID=2316734 RepID=UPI000EA295FF|nr:hypothetical protein [Corallococcus sp. CA054B]RKG66218.1 hypothetical protein D7V80_20635 [Corallococcus sp. CA054B]